VSASRRDFFLSTGEVLMRIGFAGLLLPLVFAGAVAADPIQSLRCNDANGLPARNGQKVTVSGVVVGQFSLANAARLYVQDATGAVNVYGRPKNCAAVGDSVRVTGTVSSYRGLTQITGNDSTLVIVVLGHAARVPAPLVLTVDQALHTEEARGCEPNESRLIELPSVWIRAADGSALTAGAVFKDDTNYRLAAGADSSAAWVMMRITDPEGCDLSHSLEGKPIPLGSAAHITGILSQYTPRSSNHGGYQVLPRGIEDVRGEAVKK
jgi:hypothetical protein